jgi:hypothetical protein
MADRRSFSGGGQADLWLPPQHRNMPPTMAASGMRQITNSVPCATCLRLASETELLTSVIARRWGRAPFTPVRNRDRELCLARGAFDDQQLVIRQRGDRACGAGVD